jgi:hypothetical protein
MSLDDIVQVDITAATAAPSSVGFGTPLIMSYHTVFPERARVYSSVDGMVADGFALTDPAAIKALALFSQTPKISEVIVGREALTSIKKLEITPVAADNTAYTCYVNGLEATFTSGTSATVADITAGLKTAIDALSQNVTTNDVSTNLGVAADTVDDWFTFYVDDRTLLKVELTTIDGGIATDIAAVKAYNDDWYSCHLTNQSSAVITSAAAYIETQYKILLVESQDSGIPDASVTDDIASDLATAGYARTAIMHHPKADTQCAAARWAGKCLPSDPGSITWKFQTLAGLDYIDYTTTEAGALTSKECNNYVRISGISTAQEGVTSSGEFIDVVRGIDFIRARLQEYVFGALARADKIPYTDPGVAVIVAEVTAVMKLGITNEILTDDPAPVVSAPLVSEVSTTDKANRLLPDVTFTGVLAGAIHAVEISGTVSV